MQVLRCVGPIALEEISTNVAGLMMSWVKTLTSTFLSFVQRRKVSINLAEPGDRVRLFVDSTAALYYIRKQGGTRSHALAKEAANLWRDSSTQSDCYLLSGYQLLKTFLLIFY